MRYQPVLIRKEYRDPERSMLWGSYRVRTDRWGTWLFTPAGSRTRAEQAGEVIHDGLLGANTLHLSPTGGWWFARWDDERVLYVDLARPTQVVGDEWRYSDLYLDLYKPGDVDVIVDDEDEFEAAWEAGVLTSAERAAALRAKQEAAAAIRASAPPFDSTGWSRLAEAGAIDLRPLVDLPPLLDRP